MTIHLYIVKNGETIVESEGGVISHGEECTLSEKGEVQVEALGEYLEHVEFKSCYTSDTAASTAKIILKCNESENKPIIKSDKRLRERCYGGRKQSDLIEMAGLYNLSPLQYCYEGAETFRTLLERWTKFLSDLTMTLDSNSDDVNLLIVTHNDICRVIAHSFQQMDARLPSGICPATSNIENTAFTMISINADEIMCPLLYDTTHLRHLS